MRKMDELVAKIKERRESYRFLDFFPNVLMEFLPFDKALPFCDKKSIENIGEKKAREAWSFCHPTEENVLKNMRDYMEIAWEKAEGHRGISASRSIQMMRAYTWLLGKDEKINWGNYEKYGAPILKQICELFDFPVPSSPALARMAEGMPCHPEGCDMGCQS
jgi:hypothetical protein